MSFVFAIARLMLAPLALLAAGASAQPLTATNTLETGLWELRTPGSPTRKVCLRDRNALFQVQHSDAMCSRLVIANEKSTATVHYSCPGAGWGRTTLRVSTPRSAYIDTQGIADNAPFAFIAEARRIGDCPTKSAGLDR